MAEWRDWHLSEMIVSTRDFREWLDAGVGPLLRGEGFKDHKLLFLRPLGDFTDVVEFVLERPGRRRHAMFTIEVGFFHEGIHQALWPGSPVQVPRAADCAVRLRIGRLLSDSFANFRDKWWVFKSEEDSVTAEKELLTLLPSRVLPFMAANRSLQAMRGIAEQMSSRLLPAEKLALALLCALDGDRDAGIKIIDQLLNGPPSTWADRATMLRRSLAADPRGIIEGK